MRKSEVLLCNMGAETYFSPLEFPDLIAEG
jgi:hypothetical protein